MIKIEGEVKMCTQNELSQILDRMIIVYKNVYKDAIEGIYLYGSYARNDYTPESDIDIVAIVKGKCQKKMP